MHKIIRHCAGILHRKLLFFYTVTLDANSQAQKFMSNSNQTRSYNLSISRLHRYFFWPFGKYVVVADIYEETTQVRTSSEDLPLLRNSPTAQFLSPSPTATSKPNSEWRSRGASFYLWTCFCPVLWLAHGLAVFMCGFLVVFIPMAKIQWLTMQQLLYMNPSKIRVESSMPTLRGGSSIMMCTFQVSH